jgi:hypothetical protein
MSFPRKKEHEAKREAAPLQQKDTDGGDNRRLSADYTPWSEE